MSLSLSLLDDSTFALQRHGPKYPQPVDKLKDNQVSALWGFNRGAPYLPRWTSDRRSFDLDSDWLTSSHFHRRSVAVFSFSDFALQVRHAACTTPSKGFLISVQLSVGYKSIIAREEHEPDTLTFFTVADQNARFRGGPMTRRGSIFLKILPKFSSTPSSPLHYNHMSSIVRYFGLHMAFTSPVCTRSC